MELALAAGGLAIPLADGMIKVSSGQARLSPTSVQAQGADLAVSGSVDMAQAAIDARLSMTGPAGAGSAPRPEVMISFKGPVDAPKRSIDVAVLASWLALRAVEQQSKKLDVLEGREPPTSAIEAPAATEPVAPVEPRAVGIEQEPTRPRPVPRSAPKPKSPAAEPAPALPAPAEPKAVGIEQRAGAATPCDRAVRRSRNHRPRNRRRRCRRRSTSVQHRHPAHRGRRGRRAASLRGRPASSSGPQTGQSPQPKAATPARPRSLSEILFGN